MAKLKIKQIEDLSLVGGVITIGKDNTIKPLTGFQQEAEGATGYISGLTVSGNEIVITRAALPVVNDGKLKVQFGTDGATDLFSANATGESVLTLQKVASTGAAGDVTVSNITGLLATNVQAALAELAEKTTEIAVTGQQAIDVADATGEGATGKVVSLKIAEGEQVLSQDVNGLKTDLNLTYDNSDKKIKLWGISDETPIAEVDATDFIKDGMLDSATYTELAEGQVEGQAAGKYIVLTFNTAAGKDPVYVDVTALVDTYTAKADDWIVLSDHEFSHKTTGNGTITFTGTSNDTATTPQFGETVEISIPTFTVDAAGHVTSKPDYTTAKFTLPTPEAAATYYQHYDSYELTATDETNGYVNLTNVTSNGTPVVYLNGQSLVEGAGKDYTYSGTTINVTLEALGCDLEEGDVLTYSYINTTAPTA